MAVNTNMKLKIVFGTRQFIVNCNDLTYDRAVELADRVSEVRSKSSLLSKYPMEEGETREKWLERIQPLLEKDRARKENESVEDHLKRLFNSRVDSHEAAFDIINAIGATFGNPSVTMEEFKSVNWIALKAFIYDVLDQADIDASEFRPRSLS